MTFAPSASKSQLPQRGDVVWTNTAIIKGSSATIYGWQVCFIQVYIQVVCDCFVLEELAEWVNLQVVHEFFGQQIESFQT